MIYGKWTIIEKLKGGKCIARCACGTEKEQFFSNIKSGKSTQCARCQTESYKVRGSHYDIGGTRHPLYNVWSGIKRRCYNKNQKSYKYYGLKGVTMSDEWLSDYRKFYDWMMLNGYAKGMVCSRVGDIGNYNPDNCVVKAFSENSKEVDNSSLSTIESRQRQSRSLSILSKFNYDKCIEDATSGLYKSFELVNMFGIDRHTILNMCRLNGLTPSWRRSKLTFEQIDEAKGLKLQGYTNKKIGELFNMSHEGIRSLIE